MRSLLIGLLFLIGSVVWLINRIPYFQIEASGELVNMTISELPGSCIGTRVNHYVHLVYNGETFIKKIAPQFCEQHQVGELIEMKYLEGFPDVLFPKESVLFSMIGAIALTIFGLVLCLRFLFTRSN